MIEFREVPDSSGGFVFLSRSKDGSEIATNLPVNLMIEAGGAVSNVREGIFYMFARLLDKEFPNLSNPFDRIRFRDLSRRFADRFLSEKLDSNKFVICIPIHEAKEWMEESSPTWFKKHEDKNRIVD